MHVYICLGPFIPDYQYSCLHLQTLRLFTRDLVREENIILVFEHINERCSRLCRKFPYLDFLFVFDMSLPDTLYMLL